MKKTADRLHRVDVRTCFRRETEQKCPRVLSKISSVARAAAMLAALVTAPAINAAEAMLTAVPTAWRLQQYINSGGTAETVWYTGSPCGSGNLSLGTATEAEKNRFWALVMAAKLSNHSIFVFYETTNCTITSFGMDG